MLIAIGNPSIRSHFEFSFVNVDEVLKEIKKLNSRKAVQGTYASVDIGSTKAFFFIWMLCFDVCFAFMFAHIYAFILYQTRTSLEHSKIEFHFKRSKNDIT